MNDLRSRLEAARWPAGVTDSGGLNRSLLEPAVNYWRTGFDWTAQQRALNRWPQFVATVAGVPLHFIHVRSAAPARPALLLLHGWPGSFIEFLPVAETLSAQFDLVIPSVPGFGFSAIPDAPGMSNRRIAALLAELMSQLGYKAFAVHGGDIGAGIGSWMAFDFAAAVTSLHLNFIPGSYSPTVADSVTAEEQAFLTSRAEWGERFGAYGHVQRTTPLTAAYGLSDSPVGLAAWILEKFRLWSDPASNLDVDTLLTNVSIYWFTNTIGASMRYYLESAATPLRLERRISVPTAIAHFPHEMPFPPRSWVERGYDVQRWTSMPRGGHFAALEAPDLLGSDIEAWLTGSPGHSNLP